MSMRSYQHQFLFHPQLYSTKIKGKDIKFLLQVVLAIIYQEDNFLLQLHDNMPTIMHPNRWGLFGGHMESG